MNKLIISLKDENEIYQTISLATSLKQENINCKVSILTYLDFVDCLKNLHSINQTFTINRHLIRKLYQSKLFSDGFSLNILSDDLEPLKAVKWDEIINFSNNEIATRICTILSSNNYFGKKYNSQNTVKFSNQWAIFQNEVFNNLMINPIHPLELSTIICDLQPVSNALSENQKNFSELTFEFNSHSEKVVRDNIDLLKSQNNNHNLQFIGVAFGRGEFWDNMSNCLDLISLIAKHGHYYPILIHLNNSDESEKCIMVNAEYNNQLTIVECDHISARSILKNIDLLIGPESAFSHYADLLSLPHIDIFTNQNDLFRGHPIGQNNLSLLINSSGLEAAQIYQALDYFATGCVVDEEFTFETYKIEQDAFGAKLSLINLGSVNKEIMAYEYYRLYLLSINELLTEDLLKKLIERYGKSLIEWQKFEEDKMIEISKDLLRNLRIIQQLKKDHEIDNQTDMKILIDAIDRLLDNIDNLSFTSIPLLVFQTNLHNAPKTNLKTMLKVVERICYDLKKSLKIQLNLLSLIENYSAKRSLKLSKSNNEYTI